MAPKHTIVVAGYGTGISAAVARLFGGKGYAVALLARTAAKLDAAAAELEKAGIKAAGFPTDLTDAAAVTAAVKRASQELGPVGILFWNPYGQLATATAGDPAHFTANFQAAAAGLVAAVQAAHADLAAAKGAVLVTGGWLSDEGDAATDFAIKWGADSLAVSKAAQRKLVHILNKRLAKEGVYAFEVTVYGVVKGTAWDPKGEGTLTAEAVADRFAETLEARDTAVWATAIR